MRVKLLAVYSEAAPGLFFSSIRSKVSAIYNKEPKSVTSFN